MPAKHSPSSVKNPLIKFLGSIQLAVPLLMAIAAVLIGTTFYESRVGSEIVQRDIYKSAWFGLLMFLLAVNLSVSAMSRFPWRGARKVGFALTHFGLVILIAGSAAVIHLGVEGMLPLRTDIGGNRLLRLQGELLEVLTANGSSSAVDVQVGADGSIEHESIASLELVQYRERTLAQNRFLPDGLAPNPALHFTLTSQTMGQSVEKWLAIAPSSAQQVNLGPATLKLASVRSQSELDAMMAPPPEIQGKWGSVLLAGNGDRQSFDVEQSLGATFGLSEDVQVRLVNFWPDFRLNGNNEPETTSQHLRNPALQLQIESPQGVERWFVFGRTDLEPVRTLVAGEPSGIVATYQAPAPQDNVFQAIATPSGNLYYTVNNSKGFQSGPLTLEDPIDLGWADFQLEVAEYIPNARTERKIVDASFLVGAGASADAVPAVLVKSTSGQEQWLQWGEPQSIDTPDGEVYAVYRPKSMELPFAVALEDFIVERNEGSDSVAMWTSQIRIDDPEQGGHAFRKVWMNHPTWYHGWKIAQASWNPGDLRQSTLQVKREPAWVTALTWTGSLLVVAGMGVMFYGQELAKHYRTLFGSKPSRPNVNKQADPEDAETAELTPQASA